MFALVVLWLFTTPSFYQGAVLLKGRAALILSKLELEMGNEFRRRYSFDNKDKDMLPSMSWKGCMPEVAK
jgi:hypothetical protein